MKIGLRAKFGFLFLVFGCALLGAMWVMIYRFAGEMFAESYADSIGKILDVTEYSLNLTAEEVHRYGKSKGADERYYASLERMKKIREASECLYLYIIYPTGEQTAVWLFDASEDGEELGADVADYDAPESAVVREVYLSGEANKMLDLTDTDDGTVVSIYSPMKDEMGNTIAVMGADVRMDDMMELMVDSLWNITIQAMILTVFGVLFLMLFVQLGVIRSIRKLKLGVQRMADGDFGVQVSLRRKDELGQITDAFNRMSDKIRGHVNEMERLNDAYRKFIPPETFEILHKESIAEIRLGDQAQTKLVVLAMEPQDFRKKIHMMSSKETFCYINSLLDMLVPAVFVEGGTIERFEKAGVRSFYRSHAESALKSAVHACEEAGEERICAGIAQGTVMVGIAGGEERMDIISISDQMKIAEFLMEIAPKYHASILISRSAAMQIEDLEQNYHCRFMGYIKLLASEKLEGVYEVFDGVAAQERRFKQITRERFEEGVRFFGGGNYREARAAFIEVLKQYRGDDAARVYLYLCSRYLQEGQGDAWIEAL